MKLANSIDLNELHRLIKNADRLLENREHGLAVWNQMLRNTLVDILNRIAEQD